MIRSLQKLNINWAKELYTVSDETWPYDKYRRCWVCGEPFVRGDGMTVANTDKGNKLMHSRCYQAQLS